MKYYVIINGVNSLSIQGLAINKLPPISKPLMRNQIEEIDGRDGDIVTELGYSAYDKSMEIGLYGNFDIDAIIKYFTGEGTIVFSNENDKYYNFKILDQIDYEKLLKFKTAVVTFHCQPFKYPVEETPIEGETITITGSGSNITLENTIVAPMEMKVKGNTIQDGTPTPDSPVPIQVVSGDNSIKVEGKNLFNLETNNRVYVTPNTISITGTGEDFTISSTSYYDAVAFYIGIIDYNTIYKYLSSPYVAGSIWLCATNSNSYSSWSAYSSDRTVISSDWSQNSHSLSNYQGKHLWLQLRGSTDASGYTSVNYKDFVLSKTQATTYQPYQSASYPISLSSKNLLDISTMIKGTLYSGVVSYESNTLALLTNDKQISFTTNANYRGATSDYFEVDYSNVFIVFSYDNATVTPACAIAYYDENKNFIRQTSGANITNGVRFGNEPTAKYAKVCISLNTAGTVTITNPMVEITSSQTQSSYVPYMTPIELCKIGTYQDKIDKSTGKNLLNPNDTFTESTTTYSIANVKPNTTYYCKAYNTGSTYTGSFTMKAKINNSWTEIGAKTLLTGFSYTTPDNCTAIAFNGLNDLSLRICMINEGTTALPYEPYGTGWYLKKEIGKVTYNGTESWTQFVSNNRYSFYINLANGTGNDGFSNYYTFNKVDGFPGINQLVYNGNSNKNIVFRSPDESTITTAEQFKTWLTTHNTTIYYILATPTYETITDTTLLGQLEALKPYSYNPVTNITQTNNDAPLELDVSLSYTNTMNVNNVGNIYAKPILTIEGSGNIGIILNDIEVLSVDLGTDEKITIDVPNLQAYNPDNDVLLNRNVTGDYMKLLINDGDNTIAFSGSVTSATLTNYTRWI